MSQGTPSDAPSLNPQLSGRRGAWAEGRAQYWAQVPKARPSRLASKIHTRWPTRDAGTPGPIFTERVVKPPIAHEIRSAQDALALSLHERGRGVIDPTEEFREREILLAHGATMVEIFQDQQTLLDDRVAFLPFDMSHKTHTTSIMFINWVV